jgi:hypothetical protein
MATYLNADYFPEQKLFVPDFDLISKALQVKQSRYDQGFTRLKSLYNSVLNSKATNPQDIEKQAEYLKDIENNLKDLPNVDLSLPQNVSMAENVFEPFFNDKELQNDIGITKISGQQLQMGQSFLTSDDAKKRAMHSPISDEYVTLPLKELRRAKRGDGSIMNVKPRYYVPGVNLVDKLEKYLTSDKLKVISQTRDGKGAIFERVNGKLIEQPLKYLLDGLITGDERKYFDAWGEVVYDRALEEKMAQGLSETDARKELGYDLANKTRDLYTQELQNYKSAYERANTAWDTYFKANSKDGKIPNTEDAKGYRANVLFYKKQYEDYEKRLNMFDLDKTASEYTRLGKNYWSETLYSQSLDKIVKGYSYGTEQSTVKKDETFFAWLDLQEKKLDRESRERMAQMRIDAAGTPGGMTFGFDPETGQLTMIPATGTKTTKKGTTPGEPTDLQKANTPQQSLLGNVPKNTSISGLLGTMATYRKSLEGTVDAASMSFIERALRTEFPEVNTVIQHVLKRNSGDLNKESPEYLKFKGLITDPKTDIGYKDDNTELPVKKFVQKYGAEFEKWLAGKDGDKTPTYANMYSFLFGKASDNMNLTKANMPFSEWSKLAFDLENIDNAKNQLDKINNDINKISNELLAPGKNIVDPLLVVKDSHGNYRFKTRDEIKAEINDATSVIKDEEIRTPGDFGISYSTHVVTRKDPAKAKKLRYIDNNYDSIIEEFNNSLPAQDSLKLIGEKDNLAQFYGYTLADMPDLQGENAEKAIGLLLKLGSEEVSQPKLPEDNLTQILDYSKLVGNNEIDDEQKNAIRSAIGNLLNSHATSGAQHQVLYEPFTGIQGDDRYRYTIRFNDKYLEGRIAELTTQSTATNDNDAILAEKEIVKKIKANGLVFRVSQQEIRLPNKMIPGTLPGEYNITERYFQENMNYSSPEFAKDRYEYKIRKLSTGEGYEVSGTYKMPVINDNGEIEYEPVSLAGDDADQVILFPPTNSFRSVNESVVAYIGNQIALAERQNKTKLKSLKANSPQTFITVQDLDGSLNR